MQNDTYLKQLLANKTLVSDILKNKTVQWEKKPFSPLIKEKTCHRKQKISSKSLQNTGMEELFSERMHDFSSFFSSEASKLITGLCYMLVN